ncbi:MAG: sulfatase-like hydrolase/transferase, partial [Myxococcota bacterium]|nr:sulfatase-like hydrolase/transferase [Myxococcota bacterium]
MTGARLNDPAQIAWGDRWGLGEASLFATLNLVLQVMLLVYFEPQLRGLSLSSPSHWERFAFAGFSGFLLACAAVVSLCLWLLLRWSWLRALLQVPVQAAFLLFLFSDLRLYASTGLHLLDRAVLNTLANQDADRQLHLMESSSWSLLLLGTALVVLELFLLLAVRALGRRRSLRLFKLGFPTASAALLVLSLALLRLSSPLAAHGYLDGLPFFSSLLREQAAPPRLLELVYPTPPSELTASARPSILFILVESWRADALSAEKMPRLHAISSGPSCIRSAHHYAGGHTTEYGAFSLLYALNGYHYVPFREQARGSFPLALLRAAGYGLYGMSASSLKEWNHSGFITENFDHYEEHLESAELADEVLGSQELGEQLPRFDLLFFNATHHNYLYPPEYEIHTPVIAPDYDHYLGDLELRNQETGIRNRYLNALRFVDDKLSNILEREWSRVSTGELVVVITGDHGEEFWEHGLLGHGAPRFSEQRCAVPLL